MKILFLGAIKSFFLTAIVFGTFNCDTRATKKIETIKNNAHKKVESIDEKVFIESNGTKLYAEIRGKDKTNPVVLFLHGGPGDVILGLLPFQVYAGKDLEQDFVVVYLHQRGLVNSLAVPDSTQTIENHISDVKNVITFLTKKMKRSRITLMGHSWGGLLGTLYLMQDDSKVDKFIAIASPFNFEKNSIESYNYTMKWAKSEQNQNAITQLLEQAHPPINTFDKVLVKSKWASQAFGGIAKNISMKKITDSTDFKEIKKEWQLKNLDVAKTMFASLNTIKIGNEINRISIPILFIAGKNDANVPPTIVEEAFLNYKNEKEFLLFENSHHLIFVDEPELFSKQVKQFILR